MKAAKILLIFLAVTLAVVAVISAVGSSSGGEVAGGSSGKAAGELVTDTLPVAASSETKIGWGLGSSRNERGQPTDAVAANKKYAALGGVFLYGDAKQITLTFDLGYENGYTEKILDTLKAKGVKAIFFITSDYLESAPQIVRRIIDEGHVLGNHSVNHKSMPTLSNEAAAAEITGLHEAVKQQFGYEMQLFRFPMGEFSESKLALAQSLGYESWFWSFAYRDWLTDDQPDPAAALKKIVGAAHPGAVYLLHAVSSTNASIMGNIIDELTAKGYKFTIPEVKNEQS